MSNKQSSLASELERLVRASKEGAFNVLLDDTGLSREEADTVQLLNTVLSNYNAAMEYELIKYKLTSHALGIALWDMDVIVSDPVNPTHKFTWSQEFRHMLGFDNKNDFPDLLNSWSDRLHPEDKERTLDALATHINDYTGKTPYDLEYRLMMKNGQYRHFHAFGATLRNTDGVPIRVAGALEDIEEKTQMREAMEYRNKLLKTLSDTAIMFLSCKNDTFEDMMTAGINKIAGTVALDRVSVWKNYEGPDGLHTRQIYRWDLMSSGTTAPTAGLDFLYEKIAPHWKNMLGNGEVVNGPVSELPESWTETAVLKGFGVVSVFVTPIFIDKEFWGFVMLEDRKLERYFDDSSADMMHMAALLCSNTVMRAEMEREISRANQLNQTIIETMPIGMNIFDEKMNIHDINSSLTEVFKTTKEFYTTNFFSFSPEFQPDGSKSIDSAADLIRRSMTGEKLHYEWLHQTSEGEPVPCEITLTRVKREDEFIGVAFIYDLRNRKKLEQELIDAKEFAEQSSRYKSAFLANTSHEIRTPMNAILGITEIQLKNENLSPDTEEALGKIYESGNLLMSIINDILDMSKIEAGKMEILPAKYDIPSLINDSVQLNLLRYSSKSVEFSLDINANTPMNLFGDELRIKQILNNILSNAYKYTDKGKVTLSVSAEYENIGGDFDVTIIFCVSDTGQGMSEEQVNKLFDEYTRFNAGANRTTIGTGLGMSITRNLVDLMGGEIFVKSEVNKGSTFTVRLPQKRVDSIVCGPEMSEKIRDFRFHSRSIANKAQILREHMPYGRVLVVDDVETNIYVAKGMLLPYGLQIETASSGFEAIEKISGGKEYDIIFMDHMMPKMDGIETVKIIRGMGYKNSIVALTANALVGQAKMFIENGFDGYISKPIDSREMNSVLNNFIRDKKPAEVVDAARRKHSEKQNGEKSAPSDNKAISSDLKKYCALDAEKVVGVLDSMCDKINALDDADMTTYVISVHGMKSALANIGEKSLSDAAFKLEQAGKNRNFDVLSRETPAFIDALRSLIKKLNQNEETSGTEISVEDAAYLREKLFNIKTACAMFNANDARKELKDLMGKAWPHRINDALAEIDLHLLHSAFKKAAATAADIAEEK